jgi:hypothetical protein
VSFDGWMPNKRLKLAARLDYGNESFFSAPQVKRDPLGGTPPECNDCLNSRQLRLADGIPSFTARVYS